MIIAIDGYSACGKSTLAKEIAKRLNFVYIDSGAMYRAITYYFQNNNTDINDPAAIEQELNKIHIEFIPGEHLRILLNQKDITDEIRSPAISELVSEVAAISSVRKKMVQIQREISKDKSVVMDGRDIGSVVFPDADVKLFVTADLDTRTWRRHEELKSRGIDIDFSKVKENLIKRDQMDSTRRDSPLIKAPDAYVLDNTKLGKEEQTKLALEIIRNKSHIPNTN
jgi:cytidylate kinase